MRPIDFNALMHSASYWLCYQDKIGRGFMIQESSIKYPVADYLSGIGMPLENISLEFNHPELKYRRLDLVCTDRPIKKSDYNLLNSMEFKIASEKTKDTPEKKRIFNDIMRLYLMNDHHGTESYFVMLGKHGDFLNYFRNLNDKPPKNAPQDIPDNAEGFFTEWFGFKRFEKKLFSIESPASKEYEEIYEDFLKEYEPKTGKPDLELPKKIITECVAISSLIKFTPNPYAGAVWRIKKEN